MANVLKFLKDLAYDVYYGNGDTDHPDCPHCHSSMEFHGGNLEFGDGYWECSGCDFTFTEDDLNEIDY